MQGVKGEAVPPWRDAEPLTTQQIHHPRLSRRVKEMAAFECFVDATTSWVQEIDNRNAKRTLSLILYNR